MVSFLVSPCLHHHFTINIVIIHRIIINVIEFMISTFTHFNESLTEILKNVFGMSLNIIVKNFAQFPEIKRNSEHCNAFEMHHALESVIFFENCNEVRSRRDQE